MNRPRFRVPRSLEPNRVGLRQLSVGSWWICSTRFGILGQPFREIDDASSLFRILNAEKGSYQCVSAWNKGSYALLVTKRDEISLFKAAISLIGLVIPVELAAVSARSGRRLRSRVG